MRLEEEATSVLERGLTRSRALEAALEAMTGRLVGMGRRMEHCGQAGGQPNDPAGHEAFGNPSQNVKPWTISI